MNAEIPGLPAAIQEERVFLGGMLANPTCTTDARGLLDAECFSLDSHRRIYRAVLRTMDAGLGVDYVTVSSTLTSSKELDSIGGVPYLTSLADDAPRVLAMESYARRIREAHRNKELVRNCTSWIDRAKAGEDSLTLLGEMQAAATEHQSADSELRTITIAEAALPFIAGLKERRESTDALPGTTTGIADLDAATGGWRSGELTYVGALPGRGKTAFMVQALYAAASQGIGCGFISLEMTTAQLMGRLATIRSGLRPSCLRDAKTMNASEWQHAKQSTTGTGGLCDLPIQFCDRPGLRALQVIAIARRMQANGALVIFVDFVQLIRGEHRDPRESINAVSAALRDGAKGLGLPFVVASQLARRDANPNRRPTMQDLRESGNLEQDAHNVLLLYRPSGAAKDADGQETPPEWTGRDEIIIAKQREGVTGSVETYFDERSLSFQARSKRVFSREN